MHQLSSRLQSQTLLQLGNAPVLRGSKQGTFVCDCIMHAMLCRRLKLEKVGVTNGVMRGMSGLTCLEQLHLPMAHRITDSGLAFLSSLTHLK